VGYDIERRTNLAKRLKAARQRAALSAKEAAEKLTSLGVACSRGTLLAWERGGGRTSREPFASDLNVLATAYACSVNVFFDEMPGPDPAASDASPTLPHAAESSLGAIDQARREAPIG
jgi:transcriptional regulator with XRE-family HTH domain